MDRRRLLQLGAGAALASMLPACSSDDGHQGRASSATMGDVEVLTYGDDPRAEGRAAPAGRPQPRRGRGAARRVLAGRVRLLARPAAGRVAGPARVDGAQPGVPARRQRRRIPRDVRRRRRRHRPARRRRRPRHLPGRHAGPLGRWTAGGVGGRTPEARRRPVVEPAGPGHRRGLAGGRARPPRRGRGGPRRRRGRRIPRCRHATGATTSPTRSPACRSTSRCGASTGATTSRCRSSSRETYVKAARAAGARAGLAAVDGDHFALIDTSTPAWTRTLEILDEL